MSLPDPTLRSDFPSRPDLGERPDPRLRSDFPSQPDLGGRPDLISQPDFGSPQSNSYPVKQLQADGTQSNLLSRTNTSFDLIQLQQRMIDASLRIWQAVKGILCNDSPEGLLPEEIDESDVVDSKNILSYSFRAIHESRYGILGNLNDLK